MLQMAADTYREDFAAGEPVFLLDRQPLDAGIAIGPILFIIALLAILAAAIAAGSGAFTGSTSNEKAKLMATTLLEQASNLDDAVNLVRGNGGYPDDTYISFATDNLFMDSTNQPWGQGNYVAANCASQSAPDTCSVYKPSGGGSTPQIAPLDAIDTSVLTTLGLDTNGFMLCPSPGTDPACRAPWTAMLAFTSNGSILPGTHVYLAQFYQPLTQAVCMAINNSVGVQNSGNSGADAPWAAYAMHGPGSSTPKYDTNFYGSGVYVLKTTYAFTTSKDFCYWDTSSSFYRYVHVFK